MAVSDALQNLFNKASALSGVGSSYYSRLSWIESKNDPNARPLDKNGKPISSAGGLFQFLDGTWGDWGTGSKFGLGDNVATAIAGLTSSNKAGLSRALGRDPSYGELYLAHQQGLGGATALLRNPSANAADIVGETAVLNNGGNLGMTAGEFASLWTSKFPNVLSSAVTRPGSHPEFDESQVPANQRSDYVEPGFGDIVASYFVRLTVIILGFIFVAVGLAMFKPGLVVNALPAPAAKGVKAAASLAN